MKKLLMASALTAQLVAVPLTVSHAATSSTAKATPTPTAKKTTVKKTTATTYHYTGPVVTMQWGDVQVTITVKNKRITDVQATAPTERPRSAFINQQAVPMLRQEVLAAQSANIDLISGATMVSEAFAQSLQSAITSAKAAHTL